MKRWLFLTFIFGFIGLPGTMFLVNTLEATNEVHVTALVKDPNEVAETPSVVTTNGGGGGGGAGSNSQTNESSSDEAESSGDSADETDPDVDSETPVPQPEEDTKPTEDTKTSPAPVPTPQAAIYFGGYAFPDASVIFTVDGDAVFTVTADGDGYFEGAYDALDLGEHIFSFQAQSYDDNESRLVSYAYTVQNESPLYISSILLPPIFASTDEGQGLGGVAIPGAEIQVYGVSQGTQELVTLDTIQVNDDGTYSYDVDLKAGAYSQYYVACTFEGQECGYSGIVPVQLVGGTYEIPSNVFADFTKDIKVDFVDFSFMRAAYLSGQSILFYDLDEDGALTIKDFSLLDYQWTQ